MNSLSQCIVVDSNSPADAPLIPPPNALKCQQTWTVKVSTVEKFISSSEIKLTSPAFMLEESRYTLSFVLRKFRDGDHTRTLRLECKIDDSEQHSRVFVEQFVKAPGGYLFLRCRSKDDRYAFSHASQRLNHTFPFPIDLIDIQDVLWPGNKIMFGCNLAVVELNEKSPEQPGTNDVAYFPSVVREPLNPLLSLLENPRHADFKINVRGTIFNVHRDILSKNCTYFAAMLEHENLAEVKSGELKLDDCSPEVFSLVLKFIYSNSLKLEVESDAELVELLAAADKYGLSLLKLQVEIWLCAALRKTDNFFWVADYADKCNAPLLVAAVFRFFCQMTSELVSHMDWKEFKTDHPRLAFELFEKDALKRRPLESASNTSQASNIDG